MTDGDEVRYSDDWKQNQLICTLVSSAKSLFRRQYAAIIYGELRFEALRWSLHDLRIKGGNRNLYCLFYEHECESPSEGRAHLSHIPLPPEFADVVKAYVVHINCSGNRASSLVNGLRHLWSGISYVQGRDGFKWDQLTDAHLEVASQIVRKKVASARMYQKHWFAFVRWLQIQDVLPCDFEWRPDARAAHLTDQRKDRLPARGVLEALGAIYQKHAKSPHDRLVICAIGLLLVGGFRLSELLTLPSDCLISETVASGRIRWGLRFWNRKTTSGEFKHAVRWLSPLASDLARACIAEILELTSSARRAARRLERSAPNIVIPWAKGKEYISSGAVARALGIKTSTIPRLLRTESSVLRFRQTKYHERIYLVKDVEKVLAGRIGPLFTFQISGNRRQPLSRSLLLTHRYKARLEESELLAFTLSPYSITSFLGGNKKSKSAFERFGFDEKIIAEGGDRLTMRSHALRHWINSVANKAGMTVFQISQWMQRGEEQTRLYLHDSDDIADLSRQLIERRRIVGVAADQYDRAADYEKVQQLKTIETANVVSIGICGASLALNDCSQFKMCEEGCPAFMSVIGDGTVLPRLESRKASYDNMVARIDELTAAGTIVVERQRQMYQDCAAKIDQLILLAKTESSTKK